MKTLKIKTVRGGVHLHTPAAPPALATPAAAAPCPDAEGEDVAYTLTLLIKTAEVMMCMFPLSDHSFCLDAGQWLLQRAAEITNRLTSPVGDDAPRA
jgi:hypothetical protein